MHFHTIKNFQFGVKLPAWWVNAHFHSMWNFQFGANMHFRSMRNFQFGLNMHFQSVWCEHAFLGITLKNGHPWPPNVTHSASRRSQHSRSGHQHHARNGVCMAKLLSGKCAQMFIADSGICLHYRVKFSEITKEVILREYSRQP